MRKLLLLCTFAIAMLGGLPSLAQNICFIGTVSVEDPGTPCPLVSIYYIQKGGEIEVAGNLVEFFFQQNFPATGTLSGDLGDIDSSQLAPVLSRGCVDYTQPPSLHFITRYSFGMHQVHASFNRCDGYGPVHFEKTWTVIVLPAPPNPSPCQPELIDPVYSVPRLWLGGQIISRPSDLATAAGSVQGVAADGVARILLRIQAGDGASVFLNLVDGSGGSSTSAKEIGGLGDISAGTGASTSTSVTAHDDGFGAYAYALYQAPMDFTRAGIASDSTSAQRSVQLQVACTDSTGTTKASVDLTIVRPPVILIHGLWSSAIEAWANFIPTGGDQNLLWNNLPNGGLLTVDYKQPLSTAIATTDPPYKQSIVSKITRNAMGFDYNVPFVLDSIRSFLGTFRATLNVAAGQADVVAHSMGGNIARSMPKPSSQWTFFDDTNYQKGPIHKLITIGTPHLGTPLAQDLLSSSNDCVRKVLASKNSVSLNSVTFTDNTSFSGAVADLNYGVSASIPFPIAYLAGSTLPSNLSGLDCGGTCNAHIIRALCGGSVFPADPLANALTSQNWSTLFGEANDGIVPLGSQLNATSNLVLTFPGVIHSPGIEELGFGPPSELDSASGIPDKVMDLLNEAADSVDFTH
jgi:pimeloyl-ACP methyl ester carboxylesterase